MESWSDFIDLTSSSIELAADNFCDCKLSIDFCALNLGSSNILEIERFLLSSSSSLLSSSIPILSSSFND